MKQFIVLCAVLPLMLILMIQFGLDQVNGARISAFNQIVYTAKEAAQQRGCFTDEIQKDMRDRLERLGFAAEDISIQCDSEPKGRGEYIFYTVSVKIRRAALPVMAADDSYSYVIDSCAVSEYLE